MVYGFSVLDFLRTRNFEILSKMFVKLVTPLIIKTTTRRSGMLYAALENAPEIPFYSKASASLTSHNVTLLINHEFVALTTGVTNDP